MRKTLVVLFFAAFFMSVSSSCKTVNKPAGEVDGCSMQIDADNVSSDDFMKVARSYYGNLQKIAKDANGDCDKFGAAYLSLTKRCIDNLEIVWRGSIELRKKGIPAEDSPEFKEMSEIGKSFNEGVFDEMKKTCQELSGDANIAHGTHLGMLERAGIIEIEIVEPEEEYDDDLQDDQDDDDQHDD